VQSPSKASKGVCLEWLAERCVLLSACQTSCNHTAMREKSEGQGLASAGTVRTSSNSPHPFHKRRLKHGQGPTGPCEFRQPRRWPSLLWLSLLLPYTEVGQSCGISYSPVCGAAPIHPNDETGALHMERVSCGFAYCGDAFQLTDQIPLRSSMASSLAGRIEHMGQVGS
jgi:hypothetical protein